MKYGGIYFTAVVMAIGVLALISASPHVGFPIRVPDFTIVEWGIMLFLGVIGAAVQFAAFIWAQMKAANWTAAPITPKKSIMPHSTIVKSGTRMGNPTCGDAEISASTPIAITTAVK